VAASSIASVIIELLAPLPSTCLSCLLYLCTGATSDIWWVNLSPIIIIT
jgi:hypothetical protein